MLTALSKILSILLVPIIVVAALALLISQTVLNSQYLEGELSATNSYSRLDDAITTELVKQADMPVPGMKSRLQTVLTPVVLQQKLALALEQLQALYQGHADKAVINLTDLVSQARAQGIPIPADSALAKPITLTANSELKGAAQTFRTVKLGGLIAAIVLLAGLLLVSWKRRNWAAVPDVLMWVGVLLGIFAAVFGFGPGVAERFIKFNTASNAFAGIGHDLAVAIAHDLAKRLAIVAGSYFVVGLTLRLIWGRHHKKQRPAFLKQK